MIHSRRLLRRLLRRLTWLCLLFADGGAAVCERRWRERGHRHAHGSGELGEGPQGQRGHAGRPRLLASIKRGISACCLQLAVTCMSQEEVSELYVSRAQQMEEEGQYKEAER